MIQKTVLFAFLFISSLTLLANGGGVYAISSVTGSTNPMFKDITDIEIISENLYIRLNGARSEVTVEYYLWNKSNTDYNGIDYGFPVDYLHGDESVFQWNDSYISDMRFVVDGTDLAVSASEAVAYIHPKEGLEKSDDGSFYDTYGRALGNHRKWFYSQLSFPKGTITKLVVHYSLANYNTCDGYSPLNLDIIDGCTGRFLAYDFSPASHWGSGIIRDFYLRVDVTDLALSGDLMGEDMQPPTFEGLELTQTGNVYEYRTRNFDLNTAEPLLIEYNANEQSSLDILRTYLISPTRYKMTSSVNLPNYLATNANDLNLETAWVAPNGGVGEWIEFEFAKDFLDLNGFVLVGGYWKNETTYKENNRIKRMKIEAKFEGLEEWVVDEYTASFADTEYYPIYFSNLFTKGDFYRDFFESFHEVARYTNGTDADKMRMEKIRFTIEEVYPGTKYNDSCISEIILF